MRLTRILRRAVFIFVNLGKTYYNDDTVNSREKSPENPSFAITGLAGQKTLQGKVSINGAKNAALKAMAAAVLFDKKVRLENVPHTADIDTLTSIMEKLGAKISWVGEKNSKGKIIRDHVMEIDTTKIDSTDIDPKLAAGMRASVVLTGPLLARFGKVSFPAPGGCVIGARPIDLFIEGYKKMGATVTLKNGLYHISAPKGLSGMENFFHTISVGGTETLMMAATLAHGKTILNNCALEPEIVNIAEWLISCGGKIKGVGTSTVEIIGTGLNPTEPGKSRGNKLLSPVKHFVTIPDRIETGSFVLLGVLCAKDLVIENCEPKHIESLLHLLNDSGVDIKVKDSPVGKIGCGSIHIKDNIKPNSSFKSFNVSTKEYPGFPTDLQSPVVTYLTQVTGESSVLETIFEGRFKYVQDLKKIGAHIGLINPREIKIKGPTALAVTTHSKSRAVGVTEQIKPTELLAHDIRAGFAIVLAALTAEGKFIVRNAHLIDRGYEKLEERLMALGADIKRML